MSILKMTMFEAIDFAEEIGSGVVMASMDDKNGKPLALVVVCVDPVRIEEYKAAMEECDRRAEEREGGQG